MLQLPEWAYRHKEVVWLAEERGDIGFWVRVEKSNDEQSKQSVIALAKKKYAEYEAQYADWVKDVGPCATGDGQRYINISTGQTWQYSKERLCWEYVDPDEELQEMLREC